ncbi:hypothetical protein DTO027B9_748 [Paecilomyces variotii]|nr:hypothetical protein DTO027B9_748 [Paecilomyces variotii]KAJ9409904.1 hypothetical protein DTO045G8_2380 [Paecilomyces variotii]
MERTNLSNGPAEDQFFDLPEFDIDSFTANSEDLGNGAVFISALASLQPVTGINDACITTIDKSATAPEPQASNADQQTQMPESPSPVVKSTVVCPVLIAECAQQNAPLLTLRDTEVDMVVLKNRRETVLEGRLHSSTSGHHHNKSLMTVRRLLTNHSLDLILKPYREEKFAQGVTQTEVAAAQIAWQIVAKWYI